MKKIYFITVTIALTMAFINAMAQKWEFIRESDNGKTLKAISFTDSINGWMVRYDDVNNILRTEDQGDTWIEQPIQSNPGDPYFEDVHFFNQLEGLMIDSKNLHKTNDGGKTWIPVELPEVYYNYSIKLVFRDSIGYLLTQSGAMLKSVDKGNTWEGKRAVEASVPNHIYNQGIDFFNSDSAVVGGLKSGPDGFIALTRDGGETWSERNIGSWPPINAVFCADENTVYAGGRYGVFLKSTDGGETWKGEYIGVGDLNHAIDIYAIFFQNVNTGWMAGTTRTDNDMVIIRTDDGGKNWNQEFRSDVAYLKWKVKDMACSKDGTLWVCGYRGFTASNQGEFILKRSPQTEPPVGIIQNSSISSFKNYPNPFKTGTVIQLEVTKAEEIDLKVYNATGQLIEQIFTGTVNTGIHTFNFESTVAGAGLYMCVLNIDGETFTQKMTKSE